MNIQLNRDNTARQGYTSTSHYAQKIYIRYSNSKVTTAGQNKHNCLYTGSNCIINYNATILCNYTSTNIQVECMAVQRTLQQILLGSTMNYYIHNGGFI